LRVIKTTIFHLRGRDIMRFGLETWKKFTVDFDEVLAGKLQAIEHENGSGVKEVEVDSLEKIGLQEGESSKVWIFKKDRSSWKEVHKRSSPLAHRQSLQNPLIPQWFLHQKTSSEANKFVVKIFPN
jgi:hypothetical protein